MATTTGVEVKGLAKSYGSMQTGGLIRDLTVRELVTGMASLYPSPLPVGTVLDLTGIAEIAEQRTQRLSGEQTQRALVSNPDLLVLDARARRSAFVSRSTNGCT